MCVRLQPVHHFRSVTSAGPNAASQRRASSVRASSGSSRGRGSASHRSAGTQLHWLLVHDPRGRARTILPSAASWKSTHVVIVKLPAQVLPSPNAIFSRSIGTSAERSRPKAWPRASSAAAVASSASRSHASPSVAIPASSSSFA